MVVLPSFRKNFTLFLPLLHALTGLSVLSGATAPFLSINYSQKVSEQELLAYDVLILAPEAFDQLPGKASEDQKRLGYLSIAEIAPDASYRERAFESGVSSKAINQVWKSDLVDPSEDSWQKFVLERLAPSILDKGFDGFFLDTAESIEILAANDPQNAELYRNGLIELIRKLRSAHPEAEIVVNRGFSVLPELYDTVDGVLAESLYRSYDYGEGTYDEVASEDSDWLLGHLIPARDAGLDVYIVDFLPLAERDLAEKTVERIHGDGFIPLVTEPDLMGDIVAPLPVVQRKLIAVYGEIFPDGDFEWAEDTDSMTYFQLALEYLGYELEFRNYQLVGLPSAPPPDVGGFLIDSTLQVPATEQKAFVDWLAAMKASGRKIFFVGSMPFLGEVQSRRLADVFEIRGTLAGIGQVKGASIVFADPNMTGFETTPRPRVTGNMNLLAPEGAEVLVDVAIETRNGKTVRSQPIFVASWGGAALYPFLAALSPEQNPMLMVDPFALMAKMMGRSPFPVPDTTTFQGKRIYFSHIDGDGFLNFSEISPGERSGTVVRDRIIEHYGLPVTVSFIESEIKGDSTVYEEREGESFPEEARLVFENPYVEPASHTYSHPFFWSFADPTSASYETQNVNIDTEYNYSTIRYPKEIVDSVAYMNGELGVTGKKAELLLWSGNCRPPPEALKIAADAGIINMNGGNTVISKRAPLLSLISPKAVRWGGQTQVYAPIQNENNFNNSFENNRYGGYANVTQTFDLTESPRRLKPLNVYYHFYSADRFDAFTALRRAIDYCLKQDMHPLWASEFVKVVLDSLDTGIYRIGARGWRVVNGGMSQTLRLPEALGYPDLSRSVGVIGFSDHQGQRYFHTDGRKRVDLYLTDTPPGTPFLRASRVTVRNFVVDDDQVSFETFNRSRDAMELRLGGMGSRVSWRMNVDGVESVVRSSPSGTLILQPATGVLPWTLRREKS